MIIGIERSSAEGGDKVSMRYHNKQMIYGIENNNAFDDEIIIKLTTSSDPSTTTLLNIVDVTASHPIKLI